MMHEWRLSNPPMNTPASEGGRDDRGVLYHAESTLSSAQVKCSSASGRHREKERKKQAIHGRDGRTTCPRGFLFYTETLSRAIPRERRGHWTSSDFVFFFVHRDAVAWPNELETTCAAWRKHAGLNTDGWPRTFGEQQARSLPRLPIRRR